MVRYEKPVGSGGWSAVLAKVVAGEIRPEVPSSSSHIQPSAEHRVTTSETRSGGVRQLRPTPAERQASSAEPPSAPPQVSESSPFHELTCSCCSSKPKERLPFAAVLQQYLRHASHVDVRVGRAGAAAQLHQATASATAVTRACRRPAAVPHPRAQAAEGRLAPADLCRGFGRPATAPGAQRAGRRAPSSRGCPLCRRWRAGL